MADKLRQAARWAEHFCDSGASGGEKKLLNGDREIGCAPKVRKRTDSGATSGGMSKRLFEMDSAEEKKVLRSRFLALRRAIRPEERRAANAAICRNIRLLACYRAAEHVALYATDGTEPDVSSLFGERGKRFYFPRYVAAENEYELVEVDDFGSGMVRAKFGLLEPRPELPAAPVEIRKRMLMLAPAVACDRHGVRLGRGGGFYDRMLAGEYGAAVAVVYGCQLTENLPRTPHDRPVGFAVTEKEILEFS